MTRASFAAAACVALVARVAAAAAAPAVAHAGGGQPALAVGFDGQGELRAAVCAAEPCGVANGVALGLPRGWAGAPGCWAPSNLPPAVCGAAPNSTRCA